MPKPRKPIERRPFGYGEHHSFKKTPDMKEKINFLRKQDIHILPNSTLEFALAHTSISELKKNLAILKKLGKKPENKYLESPLEKLVTMLFNFPNSINSNVIEHIETLVIKDELLPQYKKIKKDFPKLYLLLLKKLGAKTESNNQFPSFKSIIKEQGIIPFVELYFRKNKDNFSISSYIDLEVSFFNLFHLTHIYFKDKLPFNKLQKFCENCVNNNLHPIIGLSVFWKILLNNPKSKPNHLFSEILKTAQTLNKYNFSFKHTTFSNPKLDDPAIENLYKYITATPAMKKRLLKTLSQTSVNNFSNIRFQKQIKTSSLAKARKTKPMKDFSRIKHPFQNYVPGKTPIDLSGLLLLDRYTVKNPKTRKSKTFKKVLMRNIFPHSLEAWKAVQDLPVEKILDISDFNPKNKHHLEVIKNKQGNSLENPEQDKFVVSQLSGIDLSKFLSNVKNPESHKKRLFRQGMEIISSLWAKGVFHGDLYHFFGPQNFVVDKNNNLVLIDFNMSQKVQVNSFKDLTKKLNTERNYLGDLLPPELYSAVQFLWIFAKDLKFKNPKTGKLKSYTKKDIENLLLRRLKEKITL